MATGLKGVNKQPKLESDPSYYDLSQFKTITESIKYKNKPLALRSAIGAAPIKYVGHEFENLDYGSSTYDEGIDYAHIQDIQDIRGEKQPWYSQLVNGVLKGVVTAGTTFLDGTVGLLYGIGSAIANGDIDEIYNNDMSRALRTVTSEMEKILPNYRTRDEQENPWALRNIFSMNTIADDFLKNIGFTVGALYSGNAYLGALRALGGAKLSGLAAKTIGSVISGVNEGRIEAGNVYDDMFNRESQAIQAETDNLCNKIIDDPSLSREEKAYQIALVQNRSDNLLNNAKERAESAAMNDLIFNSLYLPFTDAYAYGKIYARGFNTKSQLRKRAKEGVSEAVENSGKMVDNIAAQEAKKETLGNRIIKKGKEYIYDPVSRKKAALRGLKTGLSEGAEEMNQAFFSSLSSNMSQPDSPDAYYKALTDDDYKIKTKDFLTSMSEALADSWGNSETYKEGLIGFLTGILGTPTFGRVQNSDAFTYLGRGRRFGLTGGILGEMKLSNELNQQAENAVNQMNKLVDKVKNGGRFFTRSQAFNNTMDGYSEEGNKFEFENAKDNDIYNMIDAFSRTGRIDDLRDLVNQDFDNISDEELDEIVKRTTINDSSFNVGEDGTPLYHSTEQRNIDSQNSWANEDGSSMANSEKGRAEMRKKLNDNKKRILKDIDSYIDSLAKVRAISNNSLDEDQTAELAWLHWKIKKFNDRFSSVKEDSEELFSQMKKGLQQRLDELNDSIDPELDESSLGDDESYDLVKQGIAERKSVEALLKYVDFLSKARNALDLGQRINLNQELQKHLTETFNVGGKIEGGALNGLTVDAIKSAYDLFGDKLGMTSDDFTDAMKRLSDVGKMASAAITFNERFKEFSSDPMKLIQNREKIDKQENKVNKAKNINKVKDSISTMSVSDIVNQLNSGDLSEEDLDSIYPKEDQDVPVKKGEELTAAQKVKKAKEIRKKAQDVKGQIEKQVADGKIDRAVADDVEKLLGKNLENAESIDELLDSKSLAFQDPTSLMTEEDMANIDQVPSVGNELEDRLLKAAEALEEAIANANLAEDALQDLPDNIDDVVAKAEAEPEPREAGHDKTPTPEGVNPPPPNPYADNEGKKEEPKKTQAQSNLELAKEDLSEAVDLDTLGDNASKAINALATLYDAIDSFKNLKLPANKIAKLITENNSNYTKLKAILDPINKNLVGTLLQGKIGEPLQKETKSSEEVNKTGDPENIPTPALDSVDTLNNDINSSLKEPIPNNDETIKTPDGKLEYWKPTLTETDRRAERGDFTPFSKKAQNSSGYSEAQKKRMKVVGDFLLKKEAFKRVDSGKVQANSIIKFVVYPKINKDAEDFVIFMTDEDGNILGDVMFLKDSVVDNQVGLRQFINEAQEEYNKAIKDKNIDDNDESVVIELPWTSNVRQLLIGRPNYTADNDRHTLNEIFGEGKFDLGIRVANDTIRTNSRGKQGDKDEHEKGILIPRTYVPGKPYLLLPTGSQQDGKRLYAVPFVMPRYNSSNRDSMLGKAIRGVISKMVTLKGQEASKTLTREINELLSANFIGVLRFNNSNGVKITIETLDGTKKEKTFYVNDKDFISKVENFLSNLPFRIAKKYINGTYNLDGTSVRYNAMIGELANTNLPVGDARVIGNWFSVNPVGKDGKTTKAAIIRTTEQAAPASVRSDVSFKGTSYSVEKSSMTVFKDGKEYTGSDVNLIRAHAVGIMNKYDMSKPYNTDYGYYDPVKNKFITKPTEEKKEAPKLIAKNPNDDIIHITNTSNGLSHVGELQEWSQKTSDVRTEPDGWGSKDGLTYYKKTIPGRQNDNITIWFNGTFNPTVFTEERLNSIASNIDSMIEKGSTTDDLSNFIIGIIRGYGRENLSNTNTFVEQSSNNTNIKIDENKKKSYMESILKNTRYAWQAEELKHITNNPESFPSFASAFDYMIKKGIELGIDKNDTSYDKVNNYLLLLYNKPLPDNIAVIVKSTEPEEDKSTTEPEGENNEVQPPTWLSSSPAINQHIWNTLTNEQKERFSKLVGAKQKSIMKKLEQKFNKNTGKFRDGTNVDTLFRKTTNDLGVEVWDERKERRWLAKVLPELNRDERLKVVNGLIKIADTGGDAYGMFQRGLITISDRAASGTLYHEAFHSVVHTLLNDDEINKVFEAAYNKWGNIGLVGLEENLAEDFRRYVQTEEKPFTGKIIRIWRTLKHLVQSLNKKKYAVDRLFYAINRGKLKNRVQHSSRAVRYDINAREKSEIKARALANGTYMKAPNGKDTNLTEEQWLTVRTKAFKEWFGDWEKLYRYSLSVSEINDLFDNKYNALPIEDFINRSLTYYENERKEIENRISEYPQHSSEWAERQRRDNDINKNIVLLLKGLISHVDTSNLTIQKQDFRKYEKAHNIDNTETVGGAYYGATNSIFFSNSGTQGLRTMYAAHEIIHAITSNEYDNNKQFKKEVDSLYEYIKNIKPNAKLYGLSSPTEMLAEVVNPTFQEMLLTIPSRKNNKSILQEIIDCIKNCFNLKGNRTALEDLIDLIKDNARVVTFNPNSVSKVVDENGEPLVVYHGTHAGKKFNTFRIPTHIMGEETGVFFTSDQEYAKQFSPITPLFETFLNIRNPKTGVSLDRDEVVREKVYNAMENHGLTIDGLIGHDKYDSGLSLSKGTEYVVFSPNQIKSAIDNIGTFSKTDNNIYHRLVEDEQNQVEQGIRDFLSNLGITVEDMSNYNGDISLYDATRKVINAKNPEDITDGVGEAVAFLCQWQPEFRDIVSLKLAMTDSTFAKNMRRMMKKGKEFEIKDFILSNPKTPKERRDFYGSAEMQSIREAVIKEVGKDIANELRKLYDPNYKEEGKPNTITSKIRHLIEMLFDLLKNPYTRIRLERAANFSKNAAQSISKGDVSFVIRDFIKPGNGSEESRQSSLVDVRDAFVKYPREEKIISDLNEYNIALAGSTSISLAGSVYRPAENPFHDLDFQAFGKSKEDLDNIINTLFPNNEYKWAIKNKYKEGHLCHTYLILDRPFKTREVKFGKDSYVEITDANTGEVLGRHIKAELMLKDGVFGKMLDFFVTESKEEGNKLLKEHPSITYTIHDKQYLVSDEYFAMEAKATWTREKDVWDLARFKQFKDRNIDTFKEELVQYNSDKFMYSNLSQEDKDYLKERGISVDKYNKMTAEEKEILFRCKY